MKYSGFFQNLAEPVRRFLDDCNLEEKKQILQVLFQTCKEEGMGSSVKALDEALRLAPKDADSFVSAYAFVLNKPGQILKNDVPEHVPQLKEYALDFTAYAKLMGGAACKDK